MSGEGPWIMVMLSYDGGDELRLKINVEGAKEEEMRTNPKLQDAMTEAKGRAERRCRRDRVTTRMQVMVAYHETETSADTVDREQAHLDRDSGGESEMSKAGDRETDLQSWNRPDQMTREATATTEVMAEVAVTGEVTVRGEVMAEVGATTEVAEDLAATREVTTEATEEVAVMTEMMTEVTEEVATTREATIEITEGVAATKEVTTEVTEEVARTKEVMTEVTEEVVRTKEATTGITKGVTTTRKLMAEVAMRIIRATILCVVVASS
ncbi:hypothetical protein CBR_g52311 [Chara braunii]|uniref:Uncharacterized protein n=1 Tax=Chara braunii TaxID=69332 RepID=A0A388K6R2_CHABU|nr:hypothetical protein CBR_g52311 [Chara braunii]|eukprot:GBG65716.1 hypothetical protein CBR_g52311 [Chara braunii]